MAKRHFHKTDEGQRGAVVFEATISLSVFMFAIFTLLTVIRIAYAQAMMSVQLDRATKEFAKYVNVYYATGLNDTFSGEGGVSSKVADTVAEILKTVSEVAKESDVLGFVSEDFYDFLNDAGEALAGDSVTQTVKNAVLPQVVKAILNKRLAQMGDGDAGKFYKRYRVLPESLDFKYSHMLGSDNEIFVAMSFDIEVIKLLNIDFKFHCIHSACTQAWSGKN